MWADEQIGSAGYCGGLKAEAIEPIPLECRCASMPVLERLKEALAHDDIGAKILVLLYRLKEARLAQPSVTTCELDSEVNHLGQMILQYTEVLTMLFEDDEYRERIRSITTMANGHDLSPELAMNMNQPTGQHDLENNQPEGKSAEDVNVPHRVPQLIMQEASIIVRDPSSKKRKRSRSGHNRSRVGGSKRPHRLQNYEPEEKCTRAVNARNPVVQPIVREASTTAGNPSSNKRRRSVDSQYHLNSGGWKRLQHGGDRSQYAMTTAVAAATWSTKTQPRKRDERDESIEKSRKKRRKLGKRDILQEERGKERRKKRCQEIRVRRRERDRRGRRQYTRTYYYAQYISVFYVGQ